MNISLNWIKDHVPGLDRVDPKELGLKLTMSTVEVEEMKNLAEDLDKVVVGKITKLTEHPNADKLKIAIVDDGENKLKIVCGGSNLKENMFVALAKVGSRVRWHGQGDLIEMKPDKVRGEESHGMICAATELGLDHLFTDPGEKEIIDLSDFDCHPGQSLAEVLGIDDIVYEIDNKSLTNRPDLWGHYG
ncbi:MAG TPA: phenylalanine--tRNA ligase subunit beta, partial [Patescibacteria group bacterium]|nr:phenylalanine--tRNA ligase subunit beta [Patescibacteria group bacterium]